MTNGRDARDQLPPDEPVAPIGYGVSPPVMKATFMFVVQNQPTTFEALRVHLHEECELAPNCDEEGKYTFGIIHHTSEGDRYFTLSDSRKHPDTEITLTSLGEDAVAVFSGDPGEIRPIEQVLLTGMSLDGHLIDYLSVLHHHRDGISRQKVIEEMDALGWNRKDTDDAARWAERIGLATRERKGRESIQRPRFEVQRPPDTNKKWPRPSTTVADNKIM